MVPITTLQQFDNHHGCHSPHLKSTHSWLNVSPWSSAEEPYLLSGTSVLFLWLFSPRSKVNMSHLTNNTHTDPRQLLEMLLYVKTSLNCHLANEMSSSIPHEATTGVLWATAEGLSEKVSTFSSTLRKSWLHFYLKAGYSTNTSRIQSMLSCQLILLKKQPQFNQDRLMNEECQLFITTEDM